MESPLHSSAPGVLHEAKSKRKPLSAVKETIDTRIFCLEGVNIISLVPKFFLVPWNTLGIQEFYKSNHLCKVRTEQGINKCGYLAVSIFFNYPNLEDRSGEKQPTRKQL
jgi:hypothetical protein